MLDLSQLDFDKGGGLVTIVTQDARTGVVLMVAHADRQALERTLETGEMHYRSRTRGAWHKGATSGNTQRVVSLAADCDRDTVLARVEPAGPACHTGAVSCFGEQALASDVLGRLDRTIIARGAATASGNGNPESAPSPPHDDHAGPQPRRSYTARLLGDRNLRLKKLGEEAAEMVTACADGDAGRAAEEAADLIYHALVALRATGAGWDEVRTILAERGARQAGSQA